MRTLLRIKDYLFTSPLRILAAAVLLLVVLYAVLYVLIAPQPAPHKATVHPSKQPAAASVAQEGPRTAWHYAPLANFAGAVYAPAATGFTLADVTTPGQLTDLRTASNKGTEKALVRLDDCTGPTAAFQAKVQAFETSSYKSDILAYFLVDKPDPTGKFRAPACAAATLKAESDWIHQHTTAKTFITLPNMGSEQNPTFTNTYNPANSSVDYYGIAPHPCRTELKGCAFAGIHHSVQAAESWGIPQAKLVPIYQASGNGTYLLPSPTQTKDMLAAWRQETPTPPFDFADSWGAQAGNQPLSTAPQALRNVYQQHNK